MSKDKDMLGGGDVTVAEIKGVTTDLLDRCSSRNGREWLTAAKKFLRKGGFGGMSDEEVFALLAKRINNPGDNFWRERLAGLADIATVDEPALSIDLARFLGFLDKSPDPHLKWEISSNSRSLALNNISIGSIVLHEVVVPGVSCSMDDWMQKLPRRDIVRLDARFLKFFIENQHRIPEEWEKLIRFRNLASGFGVDNRIAFAGTTLINPYGMVGVPVLCCSMERGWHWRFEGVWQNWCGNSFRAASILV